MVFAGFSAESLAQRIMDCKPKVVISCNAVRRGSKVIYLKEIVDAALAESAKNGIIIGEEINRAISNLRHLFLCSFVILHKFHSFGNSLSPCRKENKK